MSVIVQDLTKIYGEQHAVDQMTFEIKTGEIVGFLGPNGAGKSTTMKMLTCYLMPTSGKATVCGYDVTTHSMEVRARLGYLPEHNPLYLEMYVKEYLHFIAGITRYKGNRAKRVKELVDMTGLGVEQHKKIGAISKGYRQRVGLAQAMLHDPEVLILDEPTTGLDPNQIVDIRNLIREVGRQKTVILSTHIMQEVQAMCNRVVIINKGKLVADSTTADITNYVKGKYNIIVSFKQAVEKAELLKIPGVEAADKKGDNWVLQSGTGQDVRETLFNWAVQQGNIILELSREGQSLENVFQQLTTGSNK